MEVPGYVQRAAVRLAADVEQHSVHPFGGDYVENRFRAALDPGEVFDENRVIINDSHAEVLDVGDGMHSTVHHGKIKRVILLVHAGGDDEIVLGQCLDDLLKAEVRGLQAERVHDDMILRRAAAHQVHARHAGDAQKARL